MRARILLAMASVFGAAERWLLTTAALLTGGLYIGMRIVPSRLQKLVAWPAPFDRSAAVLGATPDQTQARLGDRRSTLRYEVSDPYANFEGRGPMPSDTRTAEEDSAALETLRDGLADRFSAAESSRTKRGRE